MSQQANTTTKPSILDAQVITRAVLYARVSTDEQAETGTSLESQVEAGLAYAVKARLEIVAIFREDYTGTTLDRPELNRMRAMLKAGQADAVIVYKPDRLDRSKWGSNTLVLMQEFDALGVELHYAESGHKLDLDNHFDVFMWGSLGGWQAGMDRDITVKKLAKGRRDRAKQGRIVPVGKSPYGYDKVKRDGKWDFEVNEAEAEVVKMMFRLYVIGGEGGKPLTISQIAEHLTSIGIPSPKSGGLDWIPPTVGNILKSETYIGTWHYGKKRKITRRGKITFALHPRDEWIPVKVTPIIDRDLWDAAQKRRVRRAANKNHKKNPHLLTGMVTCSHCGYKMQIISTTKKLKNGERRRHIYYKCSAAKNPELRIKKCTHDTTYKGAMVESAVWQRLKSVFADEAQLMAAMDEYKKQMVEQTTPILSEIRTVENAITKAESELQALANNFREATGKRHRALIASDIDRLEQQLDGLEATRDELTKKLQDMDATPAGTENFAAFAKTIKENWAIISKDTESRRLFCQRIGLQVTLGVDNKGLHYAALTSSIIPQNWLYFENNTILVKISKPGYRIGDEAKLKSTSQKA